MGREDTEWLIFKRHPFSIFLSIIKGPAPANSGGSGEEGAFGSIPFWASDTHTSFLAMYRPYHDRGL